MIFKLFSIVCIGIPIPLSPKIEFLDSQIFSFIKSWVQFLYPNLICMDFYINYYTKKWLHLEKNFSWKKSFCSLYLVDLKKLAGWTKFLVISPNSFARLNQNLWLNSLVNFTEYFVDTTDFFGFNTPNKFFMARSTKLLDRIKKNMQ